jgi:5-(carboxyamino)imidazole ribonucleotide synthase
MYMKVGILGGGQLARMIALAGYPLGMRFVFLDPSASACAKPLGEHLLGEYHNESLLAELAKRSDVVTYEFENVPATVAAFLSARTRVYPAPNALEVAQDRLVEKNFLNALGIKTAPYAPVDCLDSLYHAASTIGYPAILKTRTQGYDGKGQFVLETEADLLPAWQTLQGLPAILEAKVLFKREVSMVGVRSASGIFAFYPLCENIHREGILRVSYSLDNDPMCKIAQDYVMRLMTALDYVGVLALEFFDMGSELFANEFAPRVHNSGHWTIDGAATSQFENHLRAIMDLPLGSTATHCHSAMINFIGKLPLREHVLAIPNAHLHLYGKAPRKGRKVAHATVCATTTDALLPLADRLIALAESLDEP